MSHHHRLPPSLTLLMPIHRLLLAGLVQGLIGVPLPTPHQLLDCQKNAYSSLHTITCTRHWVCFDFFPSGLIKRRGKIEKSYFGLKAVPFRSISVYREKGYKGKEEIRTIYLFFFRFIEFFGLAAFGLK